MLGERGGDSSGDYERESKRREKINTAYIAERTWPAVTERICPMK